MALTKVSGGILDPGINVAGIVTATGFDGPFTGGSGSNITAGIITCTELDLNGNGNISGNLVVEGNLTANGDFTTLNTTLREVELLRVDAQDDNVAAGIITQRGSGDIFSAYDTSTEVFKIADGGKIGINTTDASHLLTVFAQSASSNIARFKAFNGNSNFDIHTDGSSHGQARVRNNIGAVKVELNSNGSSYFTGGSVGVGTISPTDVLDVYSDSDPTIRSRSGSSSVGANVEICGGSSNDSQLILSSGTTSKYQFFRDGSQSDDLRIYDSANSLDIIRYRHGGYLHFGLNGKERLRIVSDGKVGINTDNPLSGLHISDSTAYGSPQNTSRKATLTISAGSEASADIQLLSANYNHIFFGDATDPNTGMIHYEHTGSNVDSLVFSTAGAEALRITSTGILELERGSAVNQAIDIKTTATTGASRIRFVESGTEKAQIAYSHNNDQLELIAHSGNQISFFAGGNQVWKFDTNGHLLPNVVGAVNIGSASAEIGNVYLADSKNVFFGSEQDAEIYHNGGSGFYLNNSTGNTYIRSGGGQILMRPSNSYDAIVAKTNEVELYYNQQNHSTPKLKTSATGITVTGEVAATQDYPNFRPTLDFNFAATKKLDPKITYQRTGVASFIDEFGLVKIVGENAPRFDHDPTTRESKGLLSEPTRTNLLKYSVDFASISGYDPNYSNARSTLSSTTEVAPDGTNTASKYVRTAGQGTGEVAIIIGNTLGLSNGTVYTSSIFVKNVGTSNILEFVNTRASDANDDSQFNLALGTITTDGSNNSLTTITPYPNDWYRVSVTATHNNLSGYFWVRMYSQPEGSGFIIWGGQVEAGRYPTSYIPTYNNASETRGEDLVLIDGTEFTDFFNTTEGTSVVHAHMPYSSTSSGLTAYAFKNSSNSNVTLSFSRDSGSDPAYHYYHDGSNSGYSRASATTDNMYKGALSFKTSDLDSYVNGSLNSNTTTFTMPTIDNLRIGGVGSENQLGGHVARFMYYPVKLTNNQLATLTS